MSVLLGNPLLVAGRSRWTPADISTALWLDAADEATITTSFVSVSGWADKSGNARDAVQATEEAQPTYYAETLGGLNVLAFDGTNDRLTTPSYTLPTTFMLLAVVRLTTASSYPMIYTANPFNFRAVSTSGRPALTDASNNFGAGESSAAPDGTTTSLVGTWSVITAVYDAGAWEIWQGGASRDTHSTSPTSFSSVVRDIGSRSDGFYWPGHIAEIIEVHGADTDQRQRMEGYAHWKWGLEAQLASGHPYENSPPYL